VREFRVINYLRSNLDNGSDASEQGGNTNAYYYNVGNNPPVAGVRGGRFADTDSIETGNNFFGLTKDLGWDTIRLRIWNEPKSETSGTPSTAASNCSPDNTRRVAKAVVGAGQNLAIDFHYADSWSDPQNQPKPYAWSDLPFPQLVQTTYDFTYDMIRSLAEQGTTPTIVALGNEITNGMLWGSEWDQVTSYVHKHHYYTSGRYAAQPGGGIKWLKYDEADGDTESAAYGEFLGSVENLALLVDAGNRAIKQLNEDLGLNIETEIHFAFNVFEQPTSGKVALDPTEVRTKVMTLVGTLSDSLKAKGGMTDRIGVSYYPDWHGTYEQVQTNIVELSKMLPGTKFNIAEGSPSYSGAVTNWMSNPNHPVGFQYSIQSQGDDTIDIMKTINDVPNNVGQGFWPWAGTNVYGTGSGANGTLRASFKAFNDAFAKNVVESGLYARTMAGTAPVLPATVRNLNVATGVSGLVAVTWDPIDPAAYASDGTFTVHGTAQVTVPAAGRGVAMRDVTATVEVVGTGGLADLIALWSSADPTPYTTGSWDALLDAIADGESVVGATSPTESEIVGAVEAIQAAVAALVTRAGPTSLLPLRAAVTIATARETDQAGTSRYTPATWANVATALSVARAILATPAASSDAEAVAATTALTSATNALVEALDTSALSTLVAIAQGILDNPSAYVSTSLPQLQTAVDAANATLARPDLTEADLAVAVPALADSLAAVQDKGNTATLAALTAWISQLREADYTPASWTDLTVAAGVAQQLIGLAEPPALAVEDAETGLLAAIDSLTVKANKAGLASMIAVAQTMVTNIDRYVPSTVTGLAAALTDAQEVNADPNASQTAVNAAQAALTAKVVAARVKASSAPLSAALTEVAGLLDSNLDPGSATALAGAIANAEAVAANAEASQAEVDAAAAALRAAASAAIAPVLQAPASGKVTLVKAAQSAITLAKGQSVRLNAAAYTDLGGKAAVAWKSSKQKVAKVSAAGKITAKAPGKSVITVTAGGKSARIAVKVVAAKSTAKVAKVKANVPKSVAVGSLTPIKASYSPAHVAKTKVAYASSDPAVLAVDRAGTLTAKAPGQAVITVKAGGKSKAYSVTVK
ncbi:MAG: glycosyl hydrolase 53 family protein, partial [Bifidobacteriaceae bacterium]|nr:glycosyl hydrolase 53 family protein [Bifidobacteriaceae bacterium]